MKDLQKLALYNSCKIFQGKSALVIYFPGIERAEVFGDVTKDEVDALITDAFLAWYPENPSFGGSPVTGEHSQLRPYYFHESPLVPQPNWVRSVWPYRPSRFPSGLRTTRRI